MLAFDARNSSENPGLHALIIGVSEYDFFEGGGARSKVQNESGGPKIDDPFGYSQLPGAARTAARVAQLLIDHKDSLNPPLRTCRLLLSPDANEKTELDDQKLPYESVRLQDVQKALIDWRDDAKRSPSDATLFFFSGHGIQQSVGSSFLLLQDLLAGAQPLDHALDFLNVYNGMRNGSNHRDMARTQIYCIDACRNSVSNLQEFENLGVAQPFKVLRSGSDDRVAPIYFGASPGHNTFILGPQGMTLFGSHFLSCFGGSAADKIRVGNRRRWAVTIGGLAEGLSKLSERFNRAHGGIRILTVTTDKWTNLNVPLLFLPDSPSVDFTLSIEPEVAKMFTLIQAVPPAAAPIQFCCPLDPHPFCKRIAAGGYTIKVTIRSSGQPFVAPPDDPVEIRGPIYYYVVQL
jgi:hypothetical protein